MHLVSPQDTGQEGTEQDALADDFLRVLCRSVRDCPPFRPAEELCPAQTLSWKGAFSWRELENMFPTHTANEESDQCVDSSQEKTDTGYPGERGRRKGHLAAPASAFRVHGREASLPQKSLKNIWPQGLYSFCVCE